METEENLQKWIDGQISLGAAANWEKDEIRIISEIAYSLAQQGRASEAIILFEGLISLAPATAYFQAALGALYLRLKNYPKAIEHLSATLNIEPDDFTSLVNRGEAYLRNKNIPEGQQDLRKALQMSAKISTKPIGINDEKLLAMKRARALLQIS